MPQTLVFIGRIETPYRTLGDCPRNVDPQGPPCRLVLDETYADGLFGLEKGDPILILYWLGPPQELVLRRPSRKDGRCAGIFALRTPARPNPIGAAVLKVEAVEEAALVVRGLDCIDGTPLLDIKPAMALETGACPPGESR